MPQTCEQIGKWEKPTERDRALPLGSLSPADALPIEAKILFRIGAASQVTLRTL